MGGGKKQKPTQRPLFFAYLPGSQDQGRSVLVLARGLTQSCGQLAGEKTSGVHLLH